MRIKTAEPSFRIRTSPLHCFCAIAAACVIMVLWSVTAYNFEISADYNRIWFLCLLLSTFSIAFKVEAEGWVRYLLDIAFLCLIATFISMAFDVFQGGLITYADQKGYNLIRNGYAFLIALSLYLLFYAIIGRIRWAALAATGIWSVFAIISYVVIATRGERLLFSDILGVGTALEVVGGYSFTLNGDFYLGVMILVTVILLCFELSTIKVGKRRKLTVRLGTLAACVGIYLLFVFSGPTQYFYSWAENQNAYLYHFLVNAELLKIEKPDNYSDSNIERIIDQGSGAAMLPSDYNAKDSINENYPYYKEKAGTDNPNIIVIMNESFTDLSTYGELDTSQPVLDNFNEIKQNAISGNLYVDVYGGGTADSEYSFFTGNSAFIVPASARPYQLYVRNDTPGFVSTLKDQGYTCDAMHPMLPENWNRNNVYPMLGFDNFYSLSDFEDPQTYRGMVSDKSTYDKVISLYENKGDTPLFLFDLTMQNHGGYALDYGDLEHVTINGQEGDYPQAEQFISLIRASDIAFGDLVNYFSNTDEPTVICMFGDHQPNLTDGFYEDSLGSSRDDLTLEQQQQQQQTPFIIWANYDIPHMEVDRMSVNYLSTMVLETAGLEQTSYNDYLAWLYSKIPVINRKGIITNDGTCYHYKNLPEQYQQLINDYKIIDFNNMVDPENRYDELFRLNKVPAQQSQSEGSTSAAETLDAAGQNESADSAGQSASEDTSGQADSGEEASVS
ncbi:MAG: LTA synthase family protein [Eubacteriaceae bacterium]|jgi:phosphoglycerol transferase MdoB-like AlkP superfamily enzyme